jgi:hypothetical protein
VVLVVGVIVARVEWREFRLFGTGMEELRPAVAAFLDTEIPRGFDEVLEVDDVGPVQPGLIRVADGTSDRSAMVLV